MMSDRGVVVVIEKSEWNVKNDYHGIVSSYVHEMLRCFSLVDVEPQSSLILISCKNKQPIYVITSSCEAVSCNVMLKT